MKTREIIKGLGGKIAWLGTHNESPFYKMYMKQPIVVDTRFLCYSMGKGPSYDNLKYKHMNFAFT